MIRNIVISVLLTPGFSLAGNSFGNGGDAVVCRTPSGQIIKAQLLDHYEFIVQGGSIDLGGANLDLDSKVRFALSRLKRLNPTRYHIFTQGHSAFFSEANFVQESLPNIDDSGDFILPRNCKVEQLAIQNEGRGENYFDWTSVQLHRYKINQDIWNALDKDSQAGLIIHELLYREGINLLNFQNSISVRKINAFISSSAIEKIDQPSYNKVLLENDYGSVDIDLSYPNSRVSIFVTYYYDGGFRRPSPPEYSNGKLKKAYLQYDVGPEGNPIPAWWDDKLHLISRNQSEILLNFDGQISALRLDTLSEPLQYPAFGQRIPLRAFAWQDGQLQVILVGTTSYDLNGKEIRVGVSGALSSLTLNSFGLPIEGTLADDFDFSAKMPRYQIKTFAGSEFRLTEDSQRLIFSSKASGVLESERIEGPLIFDLAKIKLDQFGRIELAEINDDSGSFVKGKTNLSGTSNPFVIDFSEKIAFEWNPIMRWNEIYLGAVNDPISCIFNGGLYFAKDEIRLARRNVSGLAIVGAKGIPLANSGEHITQYCEITRRKK